MPSHQPTPCTERNEQEMELQRLPESAPASLCLCLCCEPCQEMVCQEEQRSCQGKDWSATHTAPQPHSEGLQLFPQGVHVLLDVWAVVLSLGHHLLQVKLDHLRQGLATQVTLGWERGGGGMVSGRKSCCTSLRGQLCPQGPVLPSRLPPGLSPL